MKIEPIKLNDVPVIDLMNKAIEKQRLQLAEDFNSFTTYQSFIEEKQLYERIYMLLYAMPTTASPKVLQPYLVFLFDELEKAELEDIAKRFVEYLEKLDQKEVIDSTDLEKEGRTLLMRILSTFDALKS